MDFSRFCRACACEVNEACEIEDNPAKPDLPLLLKRYVPEFHIKVEEACLCFDCVSVLYSFHNFKSKCLRMEEELRLYIRKHPEMKKINLKEIFTRKEEKVDTADGLPLATTLIPEEQIKQETIEVASETSITTSIAPKFTCDICFRCFYHEQSLRAHKRKFHKHKRYQCDECNRVFDLKNKKYYEHLAYHKKPEAGRYTCKICNFVYRSPNVLSQHNIKNHLSDVQDQKLFKCEICAMRFVRKWSLTVHMRKYHTGQKVYKYKCSVCKYATNDKSQLYTHAKAMHKSNIATNTTAKHSKPESHQCGKCSRNFYKKDKRYYQHLAYHEKPEAGRYMCKICNFVYQSLGALSQHNISEHFRDEQKPFQCEVCKKRFVEKCSLTVHVRTHTGEKPYKYKCLTCEYGTNVKTLLDTHISITHNSTNNSELESTMICKSEPIFDESFITTSAAAKKHIKRERYQCDKCNRNFVIKNAYLEHVAYHKRPDADRFVCKPCNFVYQAWNSLNKHNLHIHSKREQKPFQCKVCTKRFIEEASLVEHMRTHTEEKLYKCPEKERTEPSSGKNNIDKSAATSKCDRYQCEKCNRRFRKKDRAYYEHIEYHDEPDAGRFVCEICNFVYKSLGALSQHNISNHMTDNEKPFQCEVCGKRYVEKWSLTLHIQTHASENKPSEGAIKEEPIESPSQTANTSTTTTKVICKICRRLFLSKQSLQKHIRSFHSRERYQCDKCSRDFVFKNAYYAHLAYHSKSSAGRFMCKMCNFVYHSFSALDKHNISKHSSGSSVTLSA